MYKSLLVNSPHLEIYFIQVNISFDPENLNAIDEKGRVDPSIHMSDKWGFSKGSNGGLLSTGWEKLSIRLPSRSTKLILKVPDGNPSSLKAMS